MKGCPSVQAAFDEAAKCGAAQVLLTDRPAFITQRRLAQGVWAALAPRFFAGLGIFNAAVVSGSFGVVDSQLAFDTALVTLAATLLAFLPVGLPFFEVWRFSRMAPSEIEDAVAVPEPIQENLGERMKLFGEDALLDWPGASQSIIEERDGYMARALAAAAQGARCLCVLSCRLSAHSYNEASNSVLLQPERTECCRLASSCACNCCLPVWPPWLPTSRQCALQPACALQGKYAHWIADA